MGTPILRGNDNPLLQHWELSFSPTQGGKLSKEYRGINLAKMSALCNQFVHTHSGKLRYEKNIATLTLETTNIGGSILPGGGNSPVSAIVDKWEIVVDQEKPELWENPNWMGLFTTVNAGYGVRVDQQAAQIIKQVASSADPTWRELWKEFSATNIVGNDGNDIAGPVKMSVAILATGGAYGAQFVKYFADDYLRGRTNFLHGKYMLRHTTNAPSDYGPNVADNNVEKIYTIAQLLTECQDTSLWFLPLPGYLAYKILSYPVPGEMPPNYVWGAVKTGSGAVTAANRRVEIVTEYIIDACPKHTYGLIS
jgi:hypothetical protein